MFVKEVRNSLQVKGKKTLCLLSGNQMWIIWHKLYYFDTCTNKLDSKEASSWNRQTRGTCLALYACMYVASVTTQPSHWFHIAQDFLKSKKQTQVVLLLPYRLTVSIQRVFSIIKTKLNTCLGWGIGCINSAHCSRRKLTFSEGIPVLSVKETSPIAPLPELPKAKTLKLKRVFL